jgi:hypothetical protein
LKPSEMPVPVTAAPARESAAWAAAVRLWQAHGEQQWLPVHGHSMLPLLRAGDWIQVRAQPVYTLGDLLVFVQEEQLVVHRLIGRVQTEGGAIGWRTQGDNCAMADLPITAPQIVGKVVAVRRDQGSQRLVGPLWWWLNSLIGACTAAPAILPLGGLRHLLLRLAAYRLRSGLATVTAPPINQLAYLLTRQQLTPITSAALCDLATGRAIAWDELSNVVTSHGVAPLVWRNLQAIGLADLAVPEAVRAHLQAQTYRNIAVKAGVQAKLVAICAFCDAHAVDVLLLKGAALDQLVYTQPWFVVHDVDLLLRFRPHVREADQAAHKAAIDRYFWTFPGFEYEFETHHDLTMNGLLAIDWAAIWGAAQPIALGGQRAWVMDWEDLLLVACINAARKRFFHLKSLLAIATMIEQQLALRWDAVAVKACQQEIAALVYSALLVAQLTLDVAVPPTLARQLHLSRWRVAVLRRIVRALLRLPLPLLSSAADGARTLDLFLLLPSAAYTPRQLARKAWRYIERYL